MLEIVVVGATGRVGCHVVDGLTRAGRRVRAVSRHPQPERPDVTACPADMRDAAAFPSVLPGADGIFLNLPPMLREQDLARIGDGIARAGISTAVLLSSDLVGSCPGSVMAASHEREEAVLGAILGDSLTVLRPGMFMDNDAAEWSASIREGGVVVTAFPDALELPIATADIASEAVAALTSPDPGSRPPRRILGPEWLSARDRVAVLADVLNRPIAVREVSPDEHVALLARVRPEPIVRQKVMMLAAAPTMSRLPEEHQGRSIADCPELPLGKERTCYPAWAAAHTAAFGGTGG
jgi:uncharacterized protein YbjT (DUF2867 family)